MNFTQLESLFFQEGKFRKTLAISVCLITALLFFGPYFILQENSYVCNHDTLDGALSEFQVLKNSGKIFSFSNDALIVQTMSGTVPRNAFPSPLKATNLILLLMPDFTGFLLNYMMIHILAFLGMFILLKHYVLDDKKYILFNIAISLWYGLLPVLSFFSGYAAVLPFILYVFLNFQNQVEKRSDYLIAFFIPFFSSFVLNGFFVLGLLGTWWVGLAVYRKNMNWKFMGGVALFFFGTMVAELNMFIFILLDSGFESHRIYFREQSRYDFATAIKRYAYGYFRYGHPHIAGGQEYIIFPVMLSVFWGIYKKRIAFWVWFSLILIFIFSFIGGMKQWTGVNPIEDTIPFLRQFYWNRLAFIVPFIWCVLFAWMLREWKETGKTAGLVLSLLLAGFQFTHVLKNQFEMRANLKPLTGIPAIQTWYYPKYTWNEMMSTGLYSDIKNYIGKPQESYRVASIGVWPAIAEYNGFYGIDGYPNLYPASYKRLFRKIMEKELAKSEGNARMFDQWGNRCYLLPKELEKAEETFFPKSKAAKINELILDTEILHSLNCQFIISAAEILHPETTGLEFLQSFESPESALKIFLYKVVEKEKPGSNQMSGNKAGNEQ